MGIDGVDGVCDGVVLVESLCCFVWVGDLYWYIGLYEIWVGGVGVY